MTLFDSIPTEFSKAIEAQYQALVDNYTGKRGKMDGKEMVIRHMVRTTAVTPGKQWFYAWEFLGPKGELFGSHRAPARFSDLYTLYPSVFESRSVGRFVVGRIKYESLINTISDLPDDLRAVLVGEINMAKLKGLWHYEN